MGFNLWRLTENFRGYSPLAAAEPPRCEFRAAVSAFPYPGILCALDIDSFVLDRLDID